MSDEQIKVDAERYRKLRAWLINADAFTQIGPSDSESFVMGIHFYGPTFDAAVDALPQPEEK